jgi:hypothetical protein
MYAVIIKDSDPYQYQKSKSLGIYSTLDKAKNRVMNHYTNTVAYDYEDYEYYIFRCEMDEDIETSEMGAIFSYNTD